jgi:hypothetical protein
MATGETEPDGPARQTAAANGTAPAEPGSLPPLRVSTALAAWGRALVGLGAALLAVVAVVLASAVVLAPTAWAVDLLIAVAGLPVVAAVMWIVGRAFSATNDGFVRGVTSTPLIAITPPPRPAALATPFSALRFSGLGPAAIGLGVLICLIGVGDVVATRVPLNALRLGALAVTCDGLAALAALLLALGLAIGRLGHAVAFHERTVGARFYTLATPADASGTSEIGVCAVPGTD